MKILLKIFLVIFFIGFAVSAQSKKPYSDKYLQKTINNYQKRYKKAVRKNLIKTVITEAALDVATLKRDVQEFACDLNYATFFQLEKIENFREFGKRDESQPARGCFFISHHGGRKPRFRKSLILIKYTVVDANKIKVELINDSHKDAYDQVDGDMDKIINHINDL